MVRDWVRVRARARDRDRVMVRVRDGVRVSRADGHHGDGPLGAT